MYATKYLNYDGSISAVVRNGSSSSSVTVRDTVSGEVLEDVSGTEEFVNTVVSFYLGERIAQGIIDLRGL